MITIRDTRIWIWPDGEDRPSAPLEYGAAVRINQANPAWQTQLTLDGTFKTLDVPQQPDENPATLQVLSHFYFEAEQAFLDILNSSELYNMDVTWSQQGQLPEGSLNCKQGSFQYAIIIPTRGGGRLRLTYQTNNYSWTP